MKIGRPEGPQAVQLVCGCLAELVLVPPREGRREARAEELLCCTSEDAHWAPQQSPLHSVPLLQPLLVGWKDPPTPTPNPQARSNQGGCDRPIGLVPILEPRKEEEEEASPQRRCW